MFGTLEDLIAEFDDFWVLKLLFHETEGAIHES